LIGRKGFIIVRAVEPGGCVQRASGTFHELEMAVLGNVGGSLEHHVLEEVGKTGPARTFIPGAHGIPEIHAYDGYGTIGGKGNPKAIGKPVPLYGNVQQRRALFLNGARVRGARQGRGSMDGS